MVIDFSRYCLHEFMYSSKMALEPLELAQRFFCLNGGISRVLCKSALHSRPTRIRQATPPRSFYLYAQGGFAAVLVDGDLSAVRRGFLYIVGRGWEPAIIAEIRGSTIMPLYGDGDLDHHKFIQAVVECSFLHTSR
ncbi:hypothetical protein Tco_1135776 [Tanacetum coccineum]